MEKDIQHRIRIRNAFRDEVAELIESRGFQPLFVEERADGNVSFCFGEVADQQLFALLQAIPKQAFALQARM